MIKEFLNHLLELYLEAAPWLVLGLVAAGLIQAWLPKERLYRWIGGEGFWPIVKAALIGAPLPLCSCGVLPAALSLHRAGASKGSTLSFLIATPETGPDSIAVSYALLGPFMAVVRPIAAILSSVFTGLLALLIPAQKARFPGISIAPACSGDSCCADETEPSQERLSAWPKTRDGIRYAFSNILDDLVLWLSIGLVAAALVATFVPPLAMAAWGSGFTAKLLMLLAGIPMYVCATASTPIAAGLLLAGVSPGTVLVFLLAGPATNVATIAVIRKEMGNAAVGVYLLGISLSSITLGWMTDWAVIAYDVDILTQFSAATETVPRLIAVFSGLLLLILAIRPLRRYFGPLLNRV